MLDTYSVSVTTNTWYTLKLSVNGSSLQGYLDDLEIGKIIKTDTSVTKGAVGLRTYGQSANYDNVTVESSTSVPVQDVVITYGDSGYSETGTWLTSSLTGYNGTASRYSITAGSTAKWSQYAPATGNYKIYVWYPSSNNTNSAEYTIRSLNGTWVKMIDQTQNVNAWNLIATVSGTSGTALDVTLKVKSGNTRANAVKIEYTTNAVDPVSTSPSTDSNTIGIFTNQSGFDLGKPKRATITNVPDGTPLTSRERAITARYFPGP